MTLRSALFFIVVAVSSACPKEPEPFDTARIKGSELLKANDFAGAAAEYAKSLELNPAQDAKVWDRAAFAYMNAGNYEKAAEYLEKSLDKRADQAARLETLRNVAIMYLQKAKDPDNAERYFQKVLALDAKDEQALNWLAEISSQKGGARSTTAVADSTFLTQALERYDAVIAVNPNTPNPYVNKRIVLMKYMDALTKQKAAILEDIEKQKKDKDAVADLTQQADDTQKRLDELKANFEATTQKLGEVNKALKK